MHFDIRNRDFWAGLMLIAVGAAAMWLARSYQFGTLLRMGPGYFPTVLGAVLILFGVYLSVKSLRTRDKIEGGWSIRALVVLPLSLVLFGLLVDRAGFVPALAVLIFAAAAASPAFRFGEVALLALGLTAASAAVFVWGLGLPYPLFVGL
jgi:hypothetical protein